MSKKTINKLLLLVAVFLIILLIKVVINLLLFPTERTVIKTKNDRIFLLSINSNVIVSKRPKLLFKKASHGDLLIKDEAV